MSIQSMLGAHSLVAAGIGIGDVVTLCTLSSRVGNWLSAESGDQTLLNLLEEDETSILRRKGVIDIMRFQSRWGRRLRLLQNGVPKRIEGDTVEKLLKSSSRFTAMMTCIVAALDAFTTDSTVRYIMKIFLQRLIPTSDINEDAIVSQLTTRINSWRSSGAVREMDIECRAVRNSLLDKGLIINGSMPKEEATEVADLLFWILCGDVDAVIRYTSSSDIAGIVICLTSMSFEILSVENFGSPPTTTTICRLVYSAAPLFAHGREQSDKNPKLRRDLSTTISLTQPEETFSTFPISRSVANRCRLAWKEGAVAGSSMRLVVPTTQLQDMVDFFYELKNVGVQADNGLEDIRVEPKFVKIVQALGFSTARVPAITKGIISVLSMEAEYVLEALVELVYDPNSAVVLPSVASSSLSSRGDGVSNVPAVLEAFDVFQAFVMGFYYEICLQLVDTTMLGTRSVAGTWGYRSTAIFKSLRVIQKKTEYPGETSEAVLYLRRSDVISILAILLANPEESRIDELPAFNTASRLTQGIGLGYVSKRIILPNSLLKDCQSLADVAGFTLLDTDPSAIPCNSDGLIAPGIAPRWELWDNSQPPIIEDIQLQEPPHSKEFTRHIEPDWDNIPERLLLCIRYKGRRVGVLDPIIADYNFIRSWTDLPDVEIPGSIGPVHECDWENFVSRGALPVAGSRDPDIPVVVHSKNSPCLRYAALTWYADSCAVALINGCMHTALQHARMVRSKGIAQRSLILIA